MRIRTRNKLFMFLCGWGTFPSCVEAEHGLWWFWWRRGREETP